VRSLLLNPTGFYDKLGTDGYGYLYQFESLNVGSIRNQGWELQGSANTGPITTRGTYSWTKSRTLGVTPQYRAFFTPTSYPQYQPGATFSYLPEHTWAVGITYARAQTTVSLNVNGTGPLKSLQNSFYFQHLSPIIRLPQNRFIVASVPYINFDNGYALADLNATHRLSARVETVLQVLNVTDQYTNDSYAAFASMGRQAKAGLRVRL
jgi:hypothetical protein